MNAVTAMTQLFDAGLANPQLNYADSQQAFLNGEISDPRQRHLGRGFLHGGSCKGRSRAKQLLCRRLPVAL